MLSDPRERCDEADATGARDAAEHGAAHAAPARARCRDQRGRSGLWLAGVRRPVRAPAARRVARPGGGRHGRGPRDDLPPFDDGNGHGELSDAGYRLGAREPESVVTAVLDDTLPPDQIVEASFTTTESPPDTGFGVVCRQQDNDNYYRLGIGNDGTFAIIRVQDGTSAVLTGGGQWVRDRRLPETPGFFAVRGECRGPTLALYANNQHIVTVPDAVFDRPGKVGVFAETFGGPNATITVNHLSARTFPDRSRVTDATALTWEQLVRGRPRRGPMRLRADAHRRDPGRVVRDAVGSALFVSFPDAARAAREYDRLLDAVGVPASRCGSSQGAARNTGVRGPLPPPTPPPDATGVPPSIGRVACLDLGESTAVVWLNEPAGIIGVVQIGENPRGAWRDYGRDWPPFVYQPAP